MCIMDYWDYFMNNIYNNNNIYICVYIYTSNGYIHTVKVFTCEQ